MADAKEAAKAEEKVEVPESKAEDTPEEAPKEAAAAPAEDAEMKDAAAGEEGAAKADDTPAEPEKPKEAEADAAEETRPKLAEGAADVNVSDATLNVLPTAGNKVLMTLTEGGFQYLLAGARATVGLKAGRYMLEVKILETHQRGEPAGNQQGGQGKAPQPKHLVRLGLSHGGSSLLLGDGSSEGICFDSEGFFTFEKSRKKVSSRFGRDSTVALVVNLDQASPNANTVSLFRDGVRVSEPQAIPEKLRGKPLFPHVTYKNVTLQVNLGPRPLAPLPFACHAVGSAALDDVEVAPRPTEDACEVVFPVGLPEQGYFDWVDTFLAQNPGFHELSDRKIMDWAVKSGLWKPSGPRGSSDKPEFKFGLPALDDHSVRRVLASAAPAMRRNFVVPELKANLLASERKAALAKFEAFGYKKTAMVVMGEPTAEHRERVQELILADKRAKAEAAKKRKAAEEERKRLVEEKKKKAEEARKARLAKKDGDEPKEDEAKEEDAKEDAKDEEAVIELTEEEKAMKFRKLATPDVAEAIVSKVYAEFSLPTKEDGFDEISFKWQGEAECSKFLKDWIFAKKMTQRVEDLQPGQEFKDTWQAWTKSIQAWRKLHSDWKNPGAKKALLAKRAEAKKKAAEEKGDEAPKEEEKPMEIDVEDLDVFGVEDVTDIGNGEPLFANFAYEDWTLMSVRYELHLLLLSFKKDLNDPDRPSFTEKDVSFYFNRYFKKTFALKTFAVSSFADFVELVKDTLSVDAESGFLKGVLAEDTPVSNFVKLAEDNRRERQRRLDAGDETAELKFPRTAPAPPPRHPPNGGAGAGARQGGAVGGRPAPPSHPPSRHGGSQGHYGGGGGASRGSSYSAPTQKRAYQPSGGGSSYYGSGASKHARTSSYSGGGGGGYGGGYRR